MSFLRKGAKFKERMIVAFGIPKLFGYEDGICGVCGGLVRRDQDQVQISVREKRMVSLSNPSVAMILFPLAADLQLAHLQCIPGDMPGRVQAMSEGEQIFARVRKIDVHSRWLLIKDFETGETYSGHFPRDWRPGILLHDSPFDVTDPETLVERLLASQAVFGSPLVKPPSIEDLRADRIRLLEYARSDVDRVMTEDFPAIDSSLARLYDLFTSEAPSTKMKEYYEILTEVDTKIIRASGKFSIFAMTAVSADSDRKLLGIKFKSLGKTKKVRDKLMALSHDVTTGSISKLNNEFSERNFFTWGEVHPSPGKERVSLAKKASQQIASIRDGLHELEIPARECSNDFARYIEDLREELPNLAKPASKNQMVLCVAKFLAGR